MSYNPEMRRAFNQNQKVNYNLSINNDQIEEEWNLNEDNYNNGDNTNINNLLKKTITPKFMERTSTLTGFSTNESNESYDSNNFNKMSSNMIDDRHCKKNYKIF